MKISSLVLALTMSAAPAYAFVAPEDVRPSTICSAYLDRVEDAGPPTHPMRVQKILQSLQDKLDRGVNSSAANSPRLSFFQRIREFFTTPFRARHADLKKFSSEDVTRDELTREQAFVHRRIAEALGSLQMRLDGTDEAMPVRRVREGRAAIAKYLDDLVAYSIASEEKVLDRVAANRRAAEEAVDASTLAAHERLLQLRERKGLETQAADDEGRFGPAWRAKWFGPSTDESFGVGEKAKVLAAYGLTAAAATTLSAFVSPLVVPVTLGSAAFAGWFGVRYHLYHLAEKMAVHVRAEFNFRKWKHWDSRRQNDVETKAPRGAGWLANLAELRDFAQRTDVPNGVAVHTYDVYLPLDMKFFGKEPRLDGQTIRNASAKKNPGRWLSRMVRVTQALDFDEANEPRLVTTVSEIPNDLFHPDVTKAELAFALLVFVTPK